MSKEKLKRVKQNRTSHLTLHTSQTGITLIALIITIIVMLILVGVSVTVALNGGLFSTAKEAAEETAAKRNEELQLSGQVEIDGKKYASYEDYLNNNYIEDETVDRSELSIGDYVDYTPIGTTYVTKYKDPDGVETVQSKYSGWHEDQDIYLQPTLWRVLDKHPDGTIELISEKEIYIGSEPGNTTALYLQSATGYNNGVELLNDICQELYGTGKYATKTRSLNIEDIKNRMDTTVWDWKEFVKEEVDTGKYGGTKTYEANKAYYPARWNQEVTGNVNGISTGGTLEQSDNTEELIAWDETTNTEKTGLTYFPVNIDNTSITITQTYWGRGLATNNFKNAEHHRLLINNNDYLYYYWIASRYVSATATCASFGMQRVMFGSVQGGVWFYSNNNTEPNGSYAGIRPIVTLEKDVVLKLDEENSTETVKYWNLPNSNS